MRSAAFDMNVAPPPVTIINQLIANGDLGQAGMTTLAASINAVPFEPKYLGDRGTYDYSSALTRDIRLEFDGQVITVVQSSAPGSSPTPVSLRPRTVKAVSSVRLSEEFPVLASEVSGIRELAGVSLDTIDTRASRLTIQAIRNIRSTWEYQRINAAMGIWVDADGTVIQNYFTLLGISQPTLDVTFGTPGSSKFLKLCMTLKNSLEDVLGNLDGDDGFEPLIACGRNFWANFITAADVVEAFDKFEARQQDNLPLREDLRYADFKFGGFRWRQYRGSANNTGRFLPDNEAHVIVDSVPGTYLGFWTPPEDNIHFTNAPGIPIVPAVHPLPYDEGYGFRFQSNPIHVMTRPAAAYKLFSSN